MNPSRTKTNDDSASDAWIIVCNASNRDKISAHFRRACEHHCDFRDVSDETALIALQGPRALEILSLAGANRDPAVFPDPHRFDVARDNAGKHHSFSGGRHFCLGAALARSEGEVGLRTFFERFPDAQLAGPGTRRDTRVLRGWAALPIALGQARAAVPS